MKVENLTKSYNGRTLFKDLNIEISSGLLLIQGKSGSGKSTLLKILRGIESQDDGKVIISHKEREFSYCGQDVTLIFEYSLRENFKFIFDKLDLDERLNELISYFDFDRFVDAPIYSLSGGERQKAELIIALYREVNTYYFDEPFSSIDVDTKDKLIVYLNKLSLNHLVIVINHDVTLSDLKISMKLTFNENDVEKEIIDEQNDLDKNNEIEIKQYNKKGFKFSFLTFFKINKSFLIFETILIFITLLCFTSLICSLDFNTHEDKYLIALKAGPFDYHPYRFSDFNQYGYLDIPKGEEVNSGLLAGPYSNQNAYFFDFCETDRIYFYKNLEDECPLFDLNNANYITINNDQYPVTFISDIHSEVFDIIPSFELIDQIRDRFDKETSIVLTSKNIMDSILKYEVKTCYDEIIFPLDRSLDIHIGYKSAFDDDVNVRFIDSSSEDPYYVALPRSLYSEITFIRGTQGNHRYMFEVSEFIDGDTALISVDVVKALLLRDVDKTYFLISSDDYISNLFKTYDNLYIYDVIRPWGRAFMDALMMFSLIGFIFFFIVTTIYTFFGSKTIKRSYQDLKKAFLNNNLDVSDLDGGYRIGNVSLLGAVLVFIVILYSTVGIYLSNFLLMYDNRTNFFVEGTYYYSKLPTNDYYEYLKSPIYFLGFNNLFLLCFVIIIIFIYLLSKIIIRDKKIKN